MKCDAFERRERSAFCDEIVFSLVFKPLPGRLWRRSRGRQDLGKNVRRELSPVALASDEVFDQLAHDDPDSCVRSTAEWRASRRTSEGFTRPRPVQRNSA